jgi:hypothetical protein
MYILINSLHPILPYTLYPTIPPTLYPTLHHIPYPLPHTPLPHTLPQGIAAYKTVELDEGLGGGPVQYRECEGCESQAFLLLFANVGGVEYLPGGVESGRDGLCVCVCCGVVVWWGGVGW